MAVQKVATQVIEDAAVTDAKLNTTGTMPAWNGSALTNLPESGDKRNFIIDGDFTQWPTGTSFTITDLVYHCALWENRKIGFTSLAATVSQETSVLPSSSNSNHSSVYSLKTLINTAEAAASGDFLSHRYWITGHDFARLRYDSANGAVFAFWARCSVAGTYSICLTLGSDTYSKSFVISSGDTWELIQIALPDMSAKAPVHDMHTGGGIIIDLVLAASGSRAQTDNTWSGSGTCYGVTGQTNLSDTLNATFYLSQVSLTLGSTAPTFSSPPVATVRDQVKYYVEELNPDSVDYYRFGTGSARSGTSLSCFMNYYPKRIDNPTKTLGSSTAGHYGWMNHADLNITGSALPTFGAAGGKVGMQTVNQTINSGANAGDSGSFRAFHATAKILIDARH